MDDDWAAQMDEGGDVIVKGTVEVFPGENFRIESGLATQFEQQLGLWEKMIPQVAGGGWSKHR